MVENEEIPDEVESGDDGEDDQDEEGKFQFDVDDLNDQEKQLLLAYL